MHGSTGKAGGLVIQKKICMVGMFGTGKTSLVKQFVFAKFSEKYHSTIGVKIDRKAVTAGGNDVTLLLWDLAGQDGFENVRASYLKGSAGIFFVVDGTRRETFDELTGLRQLATDTLGHGVPFVVALNKSDLAGEWRIDAPEEAALAAECHVVRTSAKTGDGVDEAFHWLAGQTLVP